MKPVKPLIARHIIAVPWRDRFKLLFTGKLYIFVGREAGQPAGVKLHSVGV